jgi:hypothetical protein
MIRTRATVLLAAGLLLLLGPIAHAQVSTAIT